MNITPQFNYLPLATAVNPPTDHLRRENHMRDVISQPAALSQSAAEKGVASEKDKARTPVQDNEFIDFVSLQDQQEQEETTVGDSTQNRNQSSDQAPDQGAQGGSQDQGRESGEEAAQDSRQEQLAEAEQLAEEKEIQALQSRDQEVRTHELAHANVGGAATGSPSYTFQVGPDGRRYAIGGEVSVDLAPVSGDPQATIAKMQKVQAAALAPVEPSGQDRQVAATAGRIILQAQSELASAEPTEDNGFSTPASADNEGAGRAEDSPAAEQGANFAGTANSGLSSGGEESDFDTLINRTLEAQEEVVPTRPAEVDARANRVENFYLNINQAYEKPPSHNFQLTA
ncbi:putative metalloprotease CJM1_0395 family protein [Thalassomonas sp. RHCl1]|uniref:putative metalloprotease CJM1_0395 family protein n=1 Tax=Thalassomonas sp. RHCl1 TaxID=2995320 RepID=UPI00248B2724|nr:putative metalloprotease CJM1_0395 family protein [Thalassomonas sp. RHCl1]